jgi:hypothetical protein
MVFLAMRVPNNPESRTRPVDKTTDVMKGRALATVGPAPLLLLSVGHKVQSASENPDLHWLGPAVVVLTPQATI